jgi:DNA invertase Pin-like site-specific DNA recombinase
VQLSISSISPFFESGNRNAGAALALLLVHRGPDLRRCHRDLDTISLVLKNRRGDENGVGPSPRKPHLDLTTPIGRGFIAFLSALAEDERQRIVGRANAGRAAAKARGAKFGRKLKLTDKRQSEGRRRLEGGDSARSIAKSFNVHHATVLKLLEG